MKTVELSVGMDVSDLYTDEEPNVKILGVFPNLDSQSNGIYPFAVKQKRMGDLGYFEVLYDSYTKEGIYNVNAPSSYDIKRKEVL